MTPVGKSIAAPTAMILGALVCFALALSMGSISGCDLWTRGATPTSGSTAGTGATGDAHAESAHRPPSKPLLEGWTSPAAAIVLSGEQRGYIEPCGCSETQSGGLARRHDLFKQLAERGWPVTAFDLGGDVGRNREQSKYKFETILDALREMKYEALALGPEELKFGVDYLLSRSEFDAKSTGPSLSIVAANVTIFESDDLSPRRFKVVQVGNVKVGVTAVLGASLRETVFPQGARGDVAISDPQEALPKTIEALKAGGANLLVLLSHATIEESRELAGKFPEFQLVVSAGGPEDPSGVPERVGESMLVTVGRKGKYAGVVGVFPDNAEEPLRFELVDLDNQRFGSSPKMNELMRQYQQRLQEFAQVILADMPSSVHPRGGSFVGAEKCGQCHTKAFAKWKETPHAHAYESLIEGRKGQEAGWVPRNHDAECLACHVTGWDPQEVLRYDSGFQLASLTSDNPHLYEKLKGQQCENCHGPGSRHVELEELWKRDRDKVSNDQVVAGRAEMKLVKEQAAQQVCHKCHDSDNSPHFKFDEYWEKIRHPWRD
jgi:hypothetical protein